MHRLIRAVALGLTAALLSIHAVAAPDNPFRNTRNTPLPLAANPGRRRHLDDTVGSTAPCNGAGHATTPRTCACGRYSAPPAEGRSSNARPVRLPLQWCTPRAAGWCCPTERAVGTEEMGNPQNALRFEFVDWSASDEAALKTYLTTAYAKARYLYGAPAFNITVKIIQDDSIDELQGGVYDATNNEIRIPPLTDNFPEDSFVLLMLVLRAFHDDIAIAYDAWEDGFGPLRRHRPSQCIAQFRPEDRGLSTRCRSTG